MEVSIKVKCLSTNTKIPQKSDKATGYKSGTMERFMKGNGLIIKHPAKEHSGMQKVIFMLESFNRIKPTGLENILMLTEVNTQANG